MVFSNLGGTTSNSFQIGTGDNPLVVSKDTIAEKGSVLNSSLTAASWTGSAAPYSYTVTWALAKTTSVITVTPSSSITLAQLEAYQNANIQSGTQADGSFILQAFGDKPTIDIPVTATIVNSVQGG